MLKKIREVIVVEGRYDKNAISQVVDCTIIETAGFGIFSDNEKITLLRRLAGKRGLIIFTDSDSAGFLIRGKLRGMLSGVNIKHAYIPDIPGRERRKKTPAKEGKIGVEGVGPDIIINALERAGATFEDQTLSISQVDLLTKADMYEIGLSGGKGSAARRRELLSSLSLPAGMSANSLLDVLNILFDREEFIAMFK